MPPTATGSNTLPPLVPSGGPITETSTFSWALFSTSRVIETLPPLPEIDVTVALSPPD
jgi:hypothetical protein